MKTEDILGVAIPATYFVLLGLERIRPARAFEPIRGWAWLGLGFMILLVSLNALLPLALPLTWLEQHRILDTSRWPLPVAILTGCLAVTFVDYWFHRAFHRFHLLWRGVHQLHHSPRRVDVLGAAFAHPLEVSISVLYSVGTTVFLLGMDPVAAAGVGYIVAFCAIFQHLNVRTPQWLGYVIQRPEAHCFHHQEDVHASNYANFPLWDMLFGTYRNPPDFAGTVGFSPVASGRIVEMLIGVDVLAVQSGDPEQRRAAKEPAQ